MKKTLQSFDINIDIDAGELTARVSKIWIASDMKVISKNTGSKPVVHVSNPQTATEKLEDVKGIQCLQKRNIRRYRTVSEQINSNRKSIHKGIQCKLA
jgi:hypothetical protein